MKISYEDYEKIQIEQRNGIYKVKYFGTYYYLNGEFHREEGPACDHIYGTKVWCINDKYHRLDGPAVEYYNGDVYKSYYIEGKRYSSKEEFEIAAYMYKNGLQDYL